MDLLAWQTWVIGLLSFGLGILPLHRLAELIFKDSSPPASPSSRSELVFVAQPWRVSAEGLFSFLKGLIPLLLVSTWVPFASFSLIGSLALAIGYFISPWRKPWLEWAMFAGIIVYHNFLFLLFFGLVVGVLKFLMHWPVRLSLRTAWGILILYAYLGGHPMVWVLLFLVLLSVEWFFNRT